jgi:L-threonylcarbamoyladenylate synthase
MLFDDKLSDIIRTLENDGVLLHPSDTVWSLSCSLNSKKGIERIYSMTNKDRSEALTILVDSIKMLKKYVPHIHPRIETLLHFHHKPLTVIYPETELVPSYARNINNSTPLRIVHDPYCNHIIGLLGYPLVSISANENNNFYPEEFSDVSKTIVSQVDFVSNQKRQSVNSNRPSVLINYDLDGEINFLRL